MTSELQEIAERVAGWAQPGEQIEAYVVRERDTDIVVYEGGIESLSSADSAGVGIRLIKDHRQGFAYSGALDEESIKEALIDARDNAGFATPDEHVGLAEPDGVLPPSLDLWRDELASFPTDQKVEMAVELERQVRAGDSRIRSLRASKYGDGTVEAAVATSTGISTSYRKTAAYIMASAIAGDEDETQTGYGYSVGRAPADLVVGDAARDAVDRATRLLGARKPKSARLTVVLDRSVTASLLGILASTLNGESVLKGRSLFAERVGEEVAASAVTLVDDPTNPEAYGASAVDGEGLACRRNVLIADGVLQGFVYNTYAARRAGVASTGSAVRAGFKGTPGIGCRALAVVPGTMSQEQVLAAVGDGLLVQSVSGLHSGVNPISGDFSVGAEGLMIRNGVLAEPVREITIASTLQRMLKDITVIGGDVEWLPSNAAGLTLAIEGVSMGGE